MDDATVEDITCDLVGYTLTLTESSGTLDGTMSGSSASRINCVVDGNPTSSNVSGSTGLNSASRNGTSITFSYVGSGGVNTMTGTIRATNFMTGAATVRLRFSSGTVRTLTGTWSAIKQ